MTLSTASQLFGIAAGARPERHVARPGIRCAHVCYKCTPPTRHFPVDSVVPACKVHGKMDKQANAPYFEMSTK